jgi:hypothetical protein
MLDDARPHAELIIVAHARCLLRKRAKRPFQNAEFIFYRQLAFSKTDQFSGTQISGFVQHNKEEIRCLLDTNTSRGFYGEG